MRFFYEFLKPIADNFSILSFYFYACLAGLVIVYYTVGKKIRIQWMILLAASLFFYLANGRKAAFWIFIPIAITYTASFVSEKTNSRKGRVLTAFVILFNVLFLIYFKEANFFIRLINRFLQFFDMPLFSEVSRKAPFGVSYITLMLISYYLDVRWKSTKAQKNPLKFLAYVLFFPITTSGPITRYSQIKCDLFEIHSFSYENFCFGVQRVLWGFFKKLVIAERIAIVVNSAYGDEKYKGIMLATGMLLFAVQMYFDFSGCMDMVIGVGKMLGIILPENFTQPFFARSLSEFWRRWHITLGFWVKDYVLYPVLKSRLIQTLSQQLKTKLGKKNRFAELLPTWCGMFCVWFIVGFWHGGDWNYIFGSGLFFFFMIAAGQAFEPMSAKATRFLRIDTETLAWKIFQRIRTAFLFCASISFDRAASFKSGLALWRRVFKGVFSSMHGIHGLSLKLILLIAFILIVEFREYKNSDNYIWQKRIAKQNLVFRWVIYDALIVFLLLFGMYGEGFNASDFIYKGF